MTRSSTLKPIPSARVSTTPHSSRRPHLHHPHKHHHHHAKDTIQSAIQLHPPSSFSDLLKQASRSSNHSSAYSVPESRRESVVRIDGSAESSIPHSELVRPEDVAKEQVRAKVREEELRSSLQAISEHSLKTTRRLDDTYYSILEKVSMLRATIGNLQELSNLTIELHDRFENDADELEGDIQGQIDAFNEFEVQQKQVDKLEMRIKGGNEKASALNERLEKARKRVEVREKIEAEWDSKMSRRLRVLWGILGTLALLFVAFLLLHQFQPSNGDATPNNSSRSSTSLNFTEVSVPHSVKEILSSCQARKTSGLTVPAVSSSSPDDDPRLRIFDEL
ncbi:hypothetical protein K432DRAFT_416311 [Lepidopterella palustris CBS 459.81]|uniref:Uncharacterized protein n=1 Tax=Lepidopterella palustris CBS 459.81 TaxID=1314670 RepID=A0A8E2JFV6_9PEZI|nr:hypothetical protein K432DRAFT_416311 [Lepidopterella palustris CBS 459.81]